MFSENINSSQELTWAEAREDVIKANAEFAAIIDQISPSKSLKLLKVTYSYGEYILKDGVICLPNEKGRVLPYTESCFSPKLKNSLAYSTIPLLLTLQKSNEVFIDTGSRIIPLNLYNPGTLLGLFETMDMLWNQSSEPKWCVTAGARSTFMLPKITEASGFKRLRVEYGLLSNTRLKYLSDHWSVFKEIANHPNFTQRWQSEILIFTSDWFKKYKNDSAWLNFQKYLFGHAWQQAKFAINKFELGLCWESYSQAITSRNLKPNVYLADQLKHIISIAAGMWPGFRPADNSQQVLPSQGLQYAFTHIYMLKEYLPTLMHISYLLSEKQVNLPVYYSLYFPAIAEGSPYNNNTSTIMLDIRTIKLLLETALQRTHNNFSKFNPIIKNTVFDYFHVDQDKFHEIQSSILIPKEDPAFLKIKKEFKDREFCSTSSFWRGCVRIWPNKF